MKVVIGSNIQITAPSRELMKYCNDHLILINPEYVKKMRMGFWVGKTPQTIALFEKRGDTLVMPFGTLRAIWPMIKSASPETAFADPQSVSFGGVPVGLYDYQEAALEALYRAKYGILQSAAGSGKTQMGIALVKRFERPALWITHTADLLNQSKERAELYVNPALIGTITEGKVNIGKGITFATVQTLSKLDLQQYRDLWDVVIVDECHHVSGSPTTITQFYKVLGNLAARHKYGLSATVHRADGLIAATHAMLGEVVWTVPDEAVADKIMKVGIRPTATGIGPSDEMLNPDGTLNFTNLISSLSGNEMRNAFISSWIVHESDHSCLILSDRIDHLQNLMDRLPATMRSKAALITGRMTTKKGKEERNAAIEKMRKGELQYLFATYSLAKEGLDIPRLERLFLTTPVKDEAVVIQSIGRIARTFPGKADPIAYDFVDNINFCKRAYKERTRHYKKINAYQA
ncbi:MAG: DEAD/DEAH box helicase [Succinivibrionaceae bacterium]|nr:DEAD/DEAH box helicase [Succinivibrionaceae bacterium]